MDDFEFQCSSAFVELGVNSLKKNSKFVDPWFLETHQAHKCSAVSSSRPVLIDRDGSSNINTDLPPQQQQTALSVGGVNSSNPTLLVGGMSKPLRTPLIQQEVEESGGKETNTGTIPSSCSASGIKTVTNSYISSNSSLSSLSMKKDSIRKPRVSTGATASSISRAAAIAEKKSCLVAAKPNLNSTRPPVKKKTSSSSALKASSVPATAASKTRKRPISATNSGIDSSATLGAAKQKKSAPRSLSSGNVDSGPGCSDDELLKRLRAHNERFVAPAAYEPPRHSVRDVRRWEKLQPDGKVWALLKPDERERANREIAEMKAAAAAAAAGRQQ